jgi:hypothetical protein
MTYSLAVVRIQRRRAKINAKKLTFASRGTRGRRQRGPDPHRGDKYSDAGVDARFVIRSSSSHLRIFTDRACLTFRQLQRG